MTTEERKERRRQYYIVNKKKKKEYQRNWYDDNKEKIRSYKKQYYIDNKEEQKRQFKINDLKRKFGITKEEYDSMFNKQNGCCRICGKHQNEFSKALAVDHDHATKKIRGLLCSNCNKGLGFFNDDINKLSIAINYLKESH